MSAWHEAYLARAAQAAEEAERAQEEASFAAEERRRLGQEQEEEAAAAAAATAADANSDGLPPLHASPSSPVTRGNRRKSVSGARALSGRAASTIPHGASAAQ